MSSTCVTVPAHLAHLHLTHRRDRPTRKSRHTLPRSRTRKEERNVYSKELSLGNQPLETQCWIWPLFLGNRLAGSDVTLIPQFPTAVRRRQKRSPVIGRSGKFQRLIVAADLPSIGATPSKNSSASSMLRAKSRQRTFQTQNLAPCVHPNCNSVVIVKTTPGRRSRITATQHTAHSYCTCTVLIIAAAGGEAKILSVSKPWKLAGWGSSFLETGWLAQRVRFPRQSS